jgi:hypothetical protein
MIEALIALCVILGFLHIEKRLNRIERRSCAQGEINRRRSALVASLAGRGPPDLDDHPEWDEDRA